MRLLQLYKSRSRFTRYVGGEWKCDGGWARVRKRVTSCRIARLNNCDPPVTSRYKCRTVGGDGRKHTYTVRARSVGSKYRSFLDSIKFIKRPESNQYTLRLTVVRSQIALGRNEESCATSRSLISLEVVIDRLNLI